MRSVLKYLGSVIYNSRRKRIVACIKEVGDEIDVI